MNRHLRAADRMAAQIDSDRARQIREAERNAMRARISSAVNFAVKNESPHLQHEAAKAVAWNARGLIAAQTDEAGACAFMGSLAHSKVADPGQAVARANAEKVFAANDGLQPVKVALSSGLRSAGLSAIADDMEAADV